ncbi:MAG: carboxylating nicotinate-nucleotide diphosphorylase [Gammaproteobacteria bacterium]|nr:carboxylating nicotinate-nucleotide diphosphorylase [Gammaproteobacteria bacterium]
MNNHDQALIDLALQEDLSQPFHDITSMTLWQTDAKSDATAVVVSKHQQPLIFCASTLISALIERFEQPYQLNSHFNDGDRVMPGEALFTLMAQSQVLMMVERTLLNFLQQLTAIATLTRQFVDKISHTEAKILDTRKTIPGWRHLAKYAVRCGGGVNHRMGLYDALMIKDNHIDALGGMAAALKKLPEGICQKYPVIVEVRNSIEVELAIKWGQGKISRLLLDNMSPQQLKAYVERCRGILPTEASGGINLATVVAVAESGVDFISIGQLTHSAAAIDLSMQIQSMESL